MESSPSHFYSSLPWTLLVRAAAWALCPGPKFTTAQASLSRGERRVHSSNWDIDRSLRSCSRAQWGTTSSQNAGSRVPLQAAELDGLEWGSGMSFWRNLLALPDVASHG